MECSIYCKDVGGIFLETNHFGRLADIYTEVKNTNNNIRCHGYHLILKLRIVKEALESERSAFCPLLPEATLLVMGLVVAKISMSLATRKTPCSTFCSLYNTFVVIQNNSKLFG